MSNSSVDGFAGGHVIRLLCLAALLLPSFAQGEDAVKPAFQIQDNQLILSHDGLSLPISLDSPRFVFGGGLEASPAIPASIKGAPETPGGMVVTYAPISLGQAATLDVTLNLVWDDADRALRKWATYTPQGGFATLAIRQIDLDTFDTAGRHLDFQGKENQSYPAFLDGFFAGIEYPVATTRVQDGKLIISHWPGRIMKPGQTRQTLNAIYGVAPLGGERARFKDYIQAHRPLPRGLHYNYNSWWTSAVPFSQEQILGIIGAFADNMFKPYGVGFDSFTIDMGWSKKDAVWEINEQLFPDGFTPLTDALHAMDTDLGLWISPTNFYSPGSFDNEWAKDHGYETMVIDWGGNKLRLANLAGKKYAEAFRDRLVDMIRRYDIRQVKLDGYFLQDPEAGPDYEAGPYSTEAMAEGGLAAFTAMREAKPDIWLETTCFGYNPSPWWLFYVNSVIGTYGDDAPRGRVACPVYRESYTTARDYYNLQGAARLPIPITGQEVLGIVHQTGEPFMNDGVVNLLRGNAFISLYVNPKFMNEHRWAMLADLLKWGKANETTLEQTTPLEPLDWQAPDAVPEFTSAATMPRQPYGYAHFNEGKNLIMLRNPWIAPQSYRLNLDESLGMPAGQKGLKAVSLYPEVRLYGDGIASGDTLDVPLAPYETVVLTLTPDPAAASLPTAASRIRGRIKADDLKTTVTRVEFTGGEESYGPGWTRLMPGETSACRLQLEGRVSLDTPGASLLILAEGDGADPDLVLSRLLIDGAKADPLVHYSTAGWSATGIPQEEFWTIMEVPMTQGGHTLSLEVFAPGKCKTLSTWVWAYDDSVPQGDLAAYPNRLPAPERLSLDGLALVEPIDAATTTTAIQGEAPVVRIEGVYLDTLAPEAATQGWGELQRNLNVTEKPLVIAGRKFLRGFGTHAPSEITYALEPGKYRRFQAWAGADNDTTPTVTFEVWLDGKKVWESGLMTQSDPAKRIDLDISGVKTLRLAVGDGGNGINGDHADWADAMLVP